MINKIRIVSCMILPSASNDIENSNFAEYLLDFIEDQGMLPPSCDGSEYTSWDDEDE